ncbi:tetratricopeptide repeat protein [Clostridium estertheticum]|uniref:Tetratricopeptide repeat protein n=1 Tax=Clostridium estertheticum TaxID=238834 RepID=A0AA47EHQ6_9CLOT|nr:tetratricopeptide repeat protein [Clostridium estertheticum]MBU3156332.1 tetratricopeptide repeat protein [Clostridium estertheticum]WAG59599.1 tetratricopeptide repeat protein [Clostridium estertheticum]
MNEYQIIPPIKNEYDFEELITDLFNEIYNTNEFYLFGRKGQSQKGIDVLGNKNTKLVIQCKEKDITILEAKNREALIADINKDVEKARQLLFKFNKLIFASTYKDDAVLQEHVRKLSECESFEIEYWGWGRISKKIVMYKSLLTKYYPNMFKGELRQLTPNPPKKKGFIGRDQELKELKELNLKSNVTLILNGMGGIGKTELAKEFYWNEYTAKSYDHFGWIDYNQNLKFSVLNQLKVGIEFEDKESDEGRFRKVIEQLNLLEGTTLLVIDNYESDKTNDDDILLNSFSSNIKVILTSREVIQSFEELRLGFLSENKCCELFYQYYKGEHNDEKLNQIIKLSGYHTLSIELLAKTAEEGDYSIDALLKLIIELGFNLNDIISDSVEHEKKYDLLFNHIRNLFVFVNIGECEKFILTNLSVLSSEFIERNVINTWLELDNNNEINKLIQKGWLDSAKIDNKTVIKCHHIIQEIVRLEFPPSSEVCKVLMKNLAIELKCEPWENRLEKSKFLNHALSVLKYIDEETFETGSILTNLSLLYNSIGDFNTALAYLMKAKKICEFFLDKDDYRLAIVYHNLSTVFISSGNMEKAKEYILISKEICEKIYDGNDPELATTYGNLSIVYQEIGNLEEALKYGLKSKEINEQLYGQNDPSLAIIYSNLTLIYQTRGDFEKALDYGLKSKEIKEKFFVNNQLSLGVAYINLSLVYRDKDELGEAIKYGEMAKEIYELICTSSHPSLVKQYTNLSIMYFGTGDLETALKYGLLSKNIGEEIYDEDNIVLSRIYSNLSAVYNSKKEFEIAVEYSLKDKKICEEKYNKKHPLLATTYNNLSMLYYELKDFEQALKYGMMAKEIREEILPKNHYLLATTYNNLSLIFEDYKNLNKALEYGLKCKDIFEKIYKPSHISLATTYFNLASMYLSKTDINNAIIYFEKSRKVYEMSIYKKNANLKNVYYVLSSLYRVKANEKNAEFFNEKFKQFR